MNQPYPPRRPQRPHPQQTPRPPYPPQRPGQRPPPPPQAPYQRPVPQQYAPPPAPARRRRVWPWVLLGMVLVPVLGFVGCAALLGGAASQVSGGPAAVVYELVGDGSATSVTYSVDGSAGIAQEAQARLPWRKEVTFSEGALRIATLSGQNGQRGGNLTCRITVDGQVVREITSSGQYAVVTCATDAF